MGVFRQFPYSNFHEMNMDEIIKIVKNMLGEWAEYYAKWDAWMTEINDDWSNYQEVMNEAWQNMQDFINNYFDNLDVQEEINNKIIAMVNSGEFATIVEPYIPPRVAEWLTAHITQPEGVVIDTSLTVAGACADAKSTGDAILDVKSEISAFHQFSIDTIPYTEGKYLSIQPVGERNYPNSLNDDQTFKVAIVPCKAGDIVILSCTGGVGPRAYAFADENNYTLERADESASYTYEKLIAPPDTAYLYVNDNSNRQTYIMLNDYVTPEMYGAVGDGVTDDTDAFKTCLEQTKPIHLSGKHYLITEDLVVKNNCTSIIGDTCGAYADNSPRLIMQNCGFDLGTYAPGDVRFEKFSIFSDTVGIQMVHATNRIGGFIAKDMFLNCGQHCVYIDMETGYIQFEDCTFQNDGVEGHNDVLVKLDYTGTGTNRINYVYFIRCNFEGGSYYYYNSRTLIYLSGCTAIQFNLCDITHCGYVFEIGSKVVQDISLTNNYFWDIVSRIINAGGVFIMTFTGNTVATEIASASFEPIIFANDRKLQTVVGNYFSDWNQVTVENTSNIFANNSIRKITSALATKLHIGEVLY